MSNKQNVKYTKTDKKMYKKELNTLLSQISGSLSKRTLDKYSSIIKESDINMNIMKSLNDKFQIVKNNGGTGLTDLKINTLIKRNNNITSKLIDVENTKNRNIRKHERDSIGTSFNETTIFASDIAGVNGFDPSLFSDYNSSNGIGSILKNVVQRKFNEVKKRNRMFGLNAFITFQVLMTNGLEFKLANINSPIRVLNTNNNVGSFISDALHILFRDLEEANKGSDWVFVNYVAFKIKSNVYKLSLGKSYIELPRAIALKKSIINPKNEKDDKCFDWCLLIHKYKDEVKTNRGYVNNYLKYWDSIIRPDNVEYPITEDMIEAYENLNDMQINVFELKDYDEEVNDDPKTCIEKIYKSTINRPDVVNLLLIRDGDNSHYTYVSNLSGLFSSKTLRKSKHMCPHCLHYCAQSEVLLTKHVEKCCNSNVDEIKRLDLQCECVDVSKNILKFKNNCNKLKHPFHIIADFESTLMKEEAVDISMCTQKYQKHMQNSFGIKYCSIHPKYDKDIEIITSPDPEEVSKQFILKLEEYARQSYDMLQLKKEDFTLTYDEQDRHDDMLCCEECKCEFTKKTKNSKTYKVVHHDVVTGKYISTMCEGCRLQFSYKTFLPVYLHNLKGYDSHLFINALHKYGDTTCELSCIPNNEEKYISFSKMIKVGEYYCSRDKCSKNITFEIRFLDTIGFMNSGIASLVGNLSKGCDTDEKLRKAFPNTSKHFKGEEELQLMTSKGIYPYDYIDSYDKLLLDKLPEQKDFHSRLYNSDCTDDDYEKAQNVWYKFGCETFLDYHNLYLKSDVLLLADVWEAFRNTCYKNYGLDCEYYYTAPGLSFDAMLKLTGIELELFTDVEMYEFCEGGIRGGLSQISTRYAKANNKYMSTKPSENKYDSSDNTLHYYDENTEESYIIYLDANNLYGHAMSQFLPYKGFKWNNDEWSSDMIKALGDEDDIGYKFEVDLHIPNELHDHFNNYVPCPENMQVKKENLNTWQQDKYVESKITKLCTSFEDKKKYIVDYRYLKLVLNLGVELITVHRVLEYQQKAFLKEYINKNTELRTIATKNKNEFEKDFFKLMNNSVFGKTMENIRQRINFRLITNEDQAWRVKNLNKFTIFSETLVGVHIQKQKILLNKPVYLGQTILDDSKALMYDFHYNFMLKKVPREDIDLLFTDTDSLCYVIRKNDIFQIMNDNREYFDLSDYPKDHELYDPTNVKVIGKFKNESIDQITEFVGLRAKLYAYSVDNKIAKIEKEKADLKKEKKDIKKPLKDIDEHMKAKGIKKCVVKKDLNLKMYRDVLFGRTTHPVKQSGIRSYGHQIYTEEVSKIALSGRDDKVYICDDNINTLNFGYNGLNYEYEYEECEYDEC